MSAIDTAKKHRKETKMKHYLLFLTHYLLAGTIFALAILYFIMQVNQGLNSLGYGG